MNSGGNLVNGGCWLLLTVPLASQVVPGAKHPPANGGDEGDAGSIPGLGRHPGGGNGNPLQSSCLVNPMNRGAWQAADHRVAKIQTRLKRLSMCIAL